MTTHDRIVQKLKTGLLNPALIMRSIDPVTKTVSIRFKHRIPGSSGSINYSEYRSTVDPEMIYLSQLPPHSFIVKCMIDMQSEDVDTDLKELYEKGGYTVSIHANCQTVSQDTIDELIRQNKVDADLCQCYVDPETFQIVKQYYELPFNYSNRVIRYEVRT